MTNKAQVKETESDFSDIQFETCNNPEDESGLSPSFKERQKAISGGNGKLIKKVVIVAKGAGKQNAPKNDEIDEFTETWGVNDAVVDRMVSRNFEIHKIILDSDTIAAKTIETVKKFNVPCMMYKHFDHIPSSIPYPLDDIIKEFGTDFFTNSIDYMLAYAIYIGVEEIDVYGVNMVLGSEYMFERPGVNFWCGMAMGKGIKVNVFGMESTIMRTQTGLLYGFERRQIIDPKYLEAAPPPYSREEKGFEPDLYTEQELDLIINGIFII